MTIILYDYPAYAVLNENISLSFISINRETAMTSQCHVTAASLKQADNEYMERRFFIRLHLKKFCASILETSHSKSRDPKQYNVEV